MYARGMSLRDIEKQIKEMYVGSKYKKDFMNDLKKV